MPILGTVASQFSGKPFSSFESIATTTVGSGGEAYIEFTSIPSTYTHLQVRVTAKMTSTGSGGDDGYFITFNGDTGSNYTRHMTYGIGTGPVYDAPGINMNYLNPYGLTYSGVYSGSNTNQAYGALIMDVLDYKNTSKKKVAKFLSGYDNNGAGDMAFTSGLWNSTSTITSIKFAPTLTVFKQYSKFALYGIRG
jgi:hypothetical protein